MTLRLIDDPTDLLVIYHGNCADGFTAAWVFWSYFRKCNIDNATFHAGTHGAPPPDVTGKQVILVDFSYEPKVLREMATKARSVTILDHHKSAAETIQPLLDDGTLFGMFDMEHSGAYLAWCWLNPDQAVPQLVLHVEDRDLWKFSIEGTREIQAAIFSYPYDFEVWDKLVADCETSHWQRLHDQGSAIERKHHKDIAELLPICTRKMVIGGVEVPVANMPYTMSSDAANILAEGAPFAACYFDRSDARVFSLRSRDGGSDVSAVAKIYGGGGHFHASGFRISFAELIALELQ